MIRFTRCVSCFAALAVLPLLAGCGAGGPPRAEVSGNVTYDGKPVENGTITFGPISGGPTAGGQIKDGKYTVKDVVIGKNVVTIMSTAAASDEPMTYESYRGGAMMEKNPNAQKQKQRQRSSTDTIPLDAVGNKATVDVTEKVQTHNFDLKKPGSK